MDEVDGMSAGDRGGVGALVALIKKTKACHSIISYALTSLTPHQIPIICIANDKGAQKLKPLISNTYNLTFRRYDSSRKLHRVTDQCKSRPEASAIRSRLLTIAFKYVFTGIVLSR